jgi:hypothetical protein
VAVAHVEDYVLIQLQRLALFAVALPKHLLFLSELFKSTFKVALLVKDEALSHPCVGFLCLLAPLSETTADFSEAASISEVGILGQSSSLGHSSADCVIKLFLFALQNQGEAFEV